MRWRSLGKAISQDFDDGLLVYHESSGETHLLVGISKQFLDYCCSGTIFGLDDLAGWARREDNNGNSYDPLPNDLILALKKLSNINLIEPVCCEYES